MNSGAGSNTTAPGVARPMPAEASLVTGLAPASATSSSEVRPPRLVRTAPGEVFLDVDYAAIGAKGPFRMQVALRFDEQAGRPVAKGLVTDLTAASGTAHCQVKLLQPNQRVRHAKIARVTLFDGERELVEHDLPFEITIP